jgi:demethylmenaquinone methyltransferase/2-methoxy-6-polyprenyl-1,4-benzoquinol methylase
MARRRPLRYRRRDQRWNGQMARTGQDDRQQETHFGFRTVGLDEKQGLVDDVFHKVASRYDLMNDLMSGGLHRAWKDAMVTQLGARPDKAFRHLDVAGGTGDVAFRILDAGGPDTHVTVLDINGDMLAVGQERAAKAGIDPAQIDFVEANAEELPLPDDSFDGYTIAFGIRNVPRIQVALNEAYRVLRRGGRLLVLEFSHVDVPGLDAIYEAYSMNVIPRLGQAVTGDAQPYQYLVESIRQFPRAEAFAGMIAQAGFRRAKFTRMTGGIVCLHSGWKL